jgi:two-component system response regulator YesN
VNMLIVDDEYNVREGLHIMLEECQLPVLPAAYAITSAADGKSALDVLNSQDIDLLITDVRMPGMDGLQLLATVRERYPHIHTVILTGYDDFDYIQQALRLGALDYLLKPVHQQDLEASLTRFLKLYKARAKTFFSWPEFNQIKGYKTIVVADLDPSDTLRAKEFGDKQTIEWILKKASMEILQESKDICLLSETNTLDTANIVFGFTAPSEGVVTEQVRNFTKALSRFWSDRIRLPISFGISRPYSQEQGEGVPYREALAALITRWSGESGVYDFEALTPVPVKNEAALQQQLMAALDIRDFDKVSALVNRFIAESSATARPTEVIQALDRILFAIYHWVHKASPSLMPMDSQDVVHFSSKLGWSRNPEMLRQAVERWINNLFLLADPENHEGQLMNKAKKYIRDHLSEPIALEDISNILFISRAHLSRLFRKRTGQTFIEYLTELRIHEAKARLAEPGIKIYEVAESIGYRDWKHFTRVFKDYTGYSPSEYRSQLHLSE